MTDVTPLPLPPRKHRWGDEIIVPRTAMSYERHERQCIACKIRKTTVLPPNGRAPYHEWRAADGKRLLLTGTPPCIVGAG